MCGGEQSRRATSAKRRRAGRNAVAAGMVGAQAGIDRRAEVGFRYPPSVAASAGPPAECWVGRASGEVATATG